MYFQRNVLLGIGFALLSALHPSEVTGEVKVDDVQQSHIESFYRMDKRRQSVQRIFICASGYKKSPMRVTTSGSIQRNASGVFVGPTIINIAALRDHASTGCSSA
jgi:hypothetical protein